MSNEPFKLSRAPIVEAIVDINCDLDPSFSLLAVEDTARRTFIGDYPNEDKQLIQEFHVETRPEGSMQSSQALLNALRFRSVGGEQLVQVRRQGFSFNRLAPYGTLDDYLPEIQTRWDSYRDIVRVKLVKQVSLRYINHIEIPCDSNGVWEISDYFKIATSNVWRDTVMVTEFLSRYNGISTEHSSGFQVILAPKDHAMGVVLDITVQKALDVAPGDWTLVYEAINVLRTFKNELFREAITDKCLQMFL